MLLHIVFFKYIRVHATISSVSQKCLQVLVLNLVYATIYSVLQVHPSSSSYVPKFHPVYVHSISFQYMQKLSPLCIQKFHPRCSFNSIQYIQLYPKVTYNTCKSSIQVFFKFIPVLPPCYVQKFHPMCSL